MKRHSLFIGIAISALFLYLAFRRTNLSEVWSHLASARYIYLLPASLLTLLAFWIRAIRWGRLLSPLRSISPGALFSATMIGFMCNNVLPMRLGEFVRAFVIGRSSGVRPAAAFATIVIERLFDLFSMIGIFGAILVFYPFHNRVFKAGVLIAFVFGLAVLAFLVVLRLKGDALLGWARGISLRPGDRAARWIPAPLRDRLLGALAKLRDRLLRALTSFRAGLEIFSDVRLLLVVGVLTLSMWLCFVFVIKFCFQAARLEEAASLPPMASLVVMVVMAIGIMVPSGPGFVGTLQAAAVLGLSMVGYGDQGRALGFSILYHATQWFPIVLVGLIYLTKEQLSLSQVGRISGEKVLGEERADPEGAPVTRDAAPEGQGAGHGADDGGGP